MKNAVLLLALVAVAAAAGFFLITGTERASSGSTADVTEVDAVGAGAQDDPIRTENDLVRVEPTTDGDAREAATIDETAPDRSAVEPRVGAVERQRPGTITGRVTDGAGRPLEDAEVLLALSQSQGLSEISFLREDRSEGSSRTVRTDSEGRFEARVDMPRVRLTVGLDGFSPLERSIDVEPDATHDLGDLRLAEGVRLGGRVLDGAGSGVAGARIIRKPKNEGGLVVFGGKRGPAVAVTGDDGRFAIARQAAGPYEFDVVHTEHPAQSFAGRTERAGEIQDDLVVTMRDGATIEGVVVGFERSGAEDLRVYASAGGSDEAGLFVLSMQPGGPATANVDGEGRFELKGLEPGAKMRLSLHEGRQRFDGSSRRARAVAATAGDRDARLTYSEGAVATFRVVDDAGTPVESLQVSAGFDYAIPRIRRSQTTANGECTVGHLWPDDAGETLKLEVQAKGFESWKAEGLVLRPEQQVDLGDVTLTRRPQVVLTVASATTGEPVEGASVTMRPYRDPTAVRSSFSRRVSIDADVEGETRSFQVEGEVRGITDAGGRCELDANPGSTVEFLVLHPAHAEMVDGPVTIAEATPITEHSLALEVGGIVRVTVVDPSGAPVEGARVERRTAERRFTMGGDTEATLTDAEGRISFDGLAPGEEFFRLKPASLGGGGGGFLMDVAIEGIEPEDDGDEWTKVTIVGGEAAEITLEAPLSGVIEGVVEELGVPLAGASITLRRPQTGPMAGMIAFGPQGPKAISDARGEFRFDDVEEGEYEFVIAHGTRAMDEVRSVEVEGAETRVTVDLDVTIVEGVVYDETGDPVAGALVRAERAQSGEQPRQRVAMVMIMDDGGGASVISSGGSNTNETRTNEDGEFSLRGVEAGVELQVEANAEGYDKARSAAFEVDAGATHDGVDVRFVKPGKIVVTLENGSGSGMAMIRRKGEFRGEPRVEPLRGNATTIDGIEPGEYTVRILGGPDGEISTDPDEVDVTVVGGETATAAFVVR